MKIFILVSTIIWSFAGGYQNTPSAYMVSGPRDAAIRVYLDKAQRIATVEPDQVEYKLYEVTIGEDGGITELAIPEIVFSDYDAKTYAVNPSDYILLPNFYPDFENWVK